jgi:hypothetical protein
LTDRAIRLDYHHYTIEVRIVGGGELVLCLNGVPRKRRRRDGLDCVYVWTNVELHWEEHHFIESRWWPSSGRLLVTANRVCLFDALV